MKNLAPYIVVHSNEDETTDVFVNDYELFDFVEDYLIENCGIEYEYLSKSKEEEETIYTMHFSDKHETPEIEKLLCKLSIKEIKEIYSLNKSIKTQ